mgnify:CR=1 FL=1
MVKGCLDNSECLDVNNSTEPAITGTNVKIT